MKLSQIPQDKANHFIYGFVIYFLFACAKEIYYEYKYGGFDWKDLVMSLIPAVFLPKNKRYGLVLLLVVHFSFAQQSIIAAGGDIENVSYTVGNNLVELQISEDKEVSLGVPKWEIPIETPKPIIKKKKHFLIK